MVSLLVSGMANVNIVSQAAFLSPLPLPSLTWVHVQCGKCIECGLVPKASVMRRSHNHRAYCRSTGMDVVKLRNRHRSYLFSDSSPYLHDANFSEAFRNEPLIQEDVVDIETSNVSLMKHAMAFAKNVRKRSFSRILRPPRGSLASSIDTEDKGKLSTLVRKTKKLSSKLTLGIGIGECAAYIGQYLLLGVLCYSFLFERWSIIDSLYFSATTFTTVGYGDLMPSSTAGKFVTCLFGLGGVTYIGAALASVGSNLIHAEVAAIEAAKKASRSKVMGVFEGIPQVLDNLHEGRHHDTKKEDDSTRPHLAPRLAAVDKSIVRSYLSRVRNAIVNYMPIFCLLLLGGIFVGRLEGWTWSDAIYYTTTTVGTVGYGDLAPRTPKTRLFAVFFIPLSVAAAGEIISNIASSMLEKRQARLYRDIMNNDMTMSDLRALDENNDGEISRQEYVEFMLVHMKLVDKETLDQLNAQFDRLDLTRSGTLSSRDLQLLHELRLTNSSTTGNGKDI